MGPSRKRFLGVVTGLPVEDRDRVTATACALAYERGARIFRVHAVAAAGEASSLERLRRALQVGPAGAQVARVEEVQGATAGSLSYPFNIVR